MANATVTITNVVGTPTTTTTTSPSLPNINYVPPFSGWLDNPINLGLIIFMLFAVFLVVGGLIYVRVKRGLAVRSGIGGKLNEALADPTVDTIAVLLDLNSGNAFIAPITHIDNIGFTADPTLPVAMVIDNPHAQKFTLGGKRLIIAPVVNKVGMEVDPTVLTSLGLTRFALSEDERSLFEDTVSPNESLEKLVVSLSTRFGSKVGKIRLAPDLYIGFAMDIPNVLKAFLTQTLFKSDILTGFMEDVTRNIDMIAQQLAVRRAQLFGMKMGSLAKVLMVAGVVILIILIGLGLFRMIAGGG